MQDNNTHIREQFSSRLGFLLITAGCAIGLGNVWRFPYITGQYGGAAFVLIYLLFLVILGIPLVSIELAIGRASRKSIGLSFETLTPNKKWYLCKYFMISGNYLLMAFYTMVTGWMLYYSYRMIKGDFTVEPLTQSKSGQYFGELLANPNSMILCTVLVTVFAFSICAFGLRKGVERITKPLMVLLFILLVFLAVHSFFLPGFEKGLEYYLKPDFSKFTKDSIYEILSAAISQAFFTLGLGIGSIQIFGSYMSKSRSIPYEATTIAILDTIVALLAGLIIFPACFSYDVQPGQGPGLIFVTLLSVFSNMQFGYFWGSLLFIFMLFAAVSTLIAVFENIIGISLDLFKTTRVKAVIVNMIIILLLSLPVILGFNELSFIKPMGENSVILDLYDFVLSQNIIELGSVVYVLYASYSYGWGFDSYTKEANLGSGFSISTKLRFYFKYVLPVIVLALFVQGYIAKFA